MSRIQSLSSFLQGLPDIRGKRRLSNLIMEWAGVLKKKDITISTRAGIFLLPNLVENISIDLFIFGFYERGLVSFLQNRIPVNGIFIDVGANIGSISIPLALVRPDIKIIAVEASTWIFKYLEKNIELNKIKNIVPLNLAAYYESGKELPIYAPKDLFGKGSLKSVYTDEPEMVQTITIDDIKNRYQLPAIHFIKIDVEGFESSVFNGMSQSILTDKPKIIFEFSEWSEITAGFSPYEAQSVILSKGYRLQKMNSRFKPVGSPVAALCKIKDANFFAF